MSFFNASVCTNGVPYFSCNRIGATQAHLDKFSKAAVPPAKAGFNQRQSVQNHSKARDPLIHVPHEITSKIFEEYHECHRDSDGDLCEVTWSPFTLGAVCRFWRRIAWATPRLWNEIQFCLTLGNECEDRLDLFEEYIARSGILPLTIHFRWVYDWDSDVWNSFNQPSCWAALHILKSYISRTKSLDLELPLNYLRALPMVLPLNPSPCLRNLRILSTDPYDVDDRLDLRPINWVSLAPSLERLQVDTGDNRVRLETMQVASSNLSYIEGFATSLNVLLRLLRRYQQLKVAIVTIDDSFMEEDEVGSQIMTSPATTLSLQQLHLACRQTNLHHFLQQTSSPNLESLRLVNRKYWELQQTDVLESFLLRNGKKLRQLELINFAWSGSDLRKIFNCLPSVESISLRPKSTDVSQIIDAIFGQATVTTDPSTLSNLRRVEIFGVLWGPEDNWDFLHSILHHVDVSHFLKQPKRDCSHTKCSSIFHSLKLTLIVQTPLVEPGCMDLLNMQTRHVAVLEELSGRNVDIHITLFDGSRTADLIERATVFYKQLI